MPDGPEAQEPPRRSGSRSDGSAGGSRGPAGTAGDPRRGGGHGGSAAAPPEPGRAGGDLAALLRAAAGSRGHAAAGAHARFRSAERAPERARKAPCGARTPEGRGMTDPPMDPDELAGLEDLAPDSPQVREAPPSTRARLHEYRDFVAPGDAPPGARVAEAERRLGEALERELGVTLGSSIGVAHASVAGSP